MAYTTMRDLDTNTLVLASDMDAIRENIEYLLNPNGGYYKATGGNYTTTSTSFVDVDATNFNFSITTYGGDLWVGCNVIVTNGSLTYTAVDVLLDGTLIGNGANYGLGRVALAGATYHLPISFAIPIPVSAGAHTVKLQWSTTGGTSTMYASSTAPAIFWAREGG